MTDAVQGAAPSTPPPKAKPAKAKAAAEPVRVSPWYLATLVGSAVFAVAAFFLVLVGLQSTGHLPPPAFSNSLCADEKLEYLRAHADAKPTLLVIGSSVAWRHFDGDAAVQASPGVRPLNAGFCGLFANQSAYAADWLLSRNPSVKDVMLIASPLDFEDCTGKPTKVFDRADVDAFVYGQSSRWSYYARYFDPVSLARNALEVAGKRSGANKVDPLVMDRYGAGPLQTDESRGLLYGKLNRQDPACFKAAAELSARLHSQGRRLMIVATPVLGEWRDLGQNRALIEQYSKALSTIPYAEFWDGEQANPPKSAFFDAVHMRWSSVPAFTHAAMSHFYPKTTAG
jgi:hypothetical protein